MVRNAFFTQSYIIDGCHGILAEGGIADAHDVDPLDFKGNVIAWLEYLMHRESQVKALVVGWSEFPCGSNTLQYSDCGNPMACPADFV